MKIFPTCLFYHLYKKFVIKFYRSQLFLLRHQCEQFCSRFIKMGQVNCTVKCCSPSGPSPGEIAAASGPPGTIRNPNKSQAKMFEENKRKAIVGQEEIAKDDNCKSLVKKYLTKDLAVQLGKKQTKMGATLWDCIQSGVANLDSGVGIYAPDAESYTVFADIFYPIIKDYHIGFDPITQKHPQTDFGLDQLEQLRNPDPENMYIISTRIRCGRSLKGYPFNPLLTKEQYKEMEQKVRDALKSLEGKHAGTYYSLAGMPKDVQQRLIDDHFLFKEGDRFLQEAQACRFWPTGRGIFHNQAKTFLVWCNEEDHLRIISMQAGGDVKEVYARLITGAQQIEKKLQFSRDATLGYLTFCPTNLGTTIRASVHIKLPRIAAKEEEFKKIALKYNLQVRGTSGEHTESKGGVYDVSNKRRMGLTEFQAVKEMYDGIVELIKLEKQATIAS